MSFKIVNCTILKCTKKILTVLFHVTELKYENFYFIFSLTA